MFRIPRRGSRLIHRHQRQLTTHHPRTIISTAGRSLHTTKPSVTPSSTTNPFSLATAWPRLQDQFAQLVNDQGQFPLLTEKQQVQLDVHLDRPVVSANKQAAAVLVLLVIVANQPSLVFTKRSAHLTSHAAELSFPGGHFEPDQDVTLMDTAIREAVEELYPDRTDDNHQDELLLFRSQLSILGTTTPLPSIKGVPVTAIVAGMLHIRFHSMARLQQTWPGNRNEVDQVFCVSLHELWTNETTHTLPKKSRFGFIASPCYPTEPQGAIWGLTAYMLQPILHQLLRPVLLPTERTD